MPNILYSMQAVQRLNNRSGKLPHKPMFDPAIVNQLGPAKVIFENPALLALLMAWVFAWKGLALWKAARLSHKWWFVILLIANTAGILEIFYIFVIARKYTVESVETVEEFGVQK